MTSTFLDIDEAKASNNHLATGYYWNNDTQSHGAITRDYLQQSGAAGIITNVIDHAKWVRSLLYRIGPLSDDTHDDIQRSRIIDDFYPAANMSIGLYGLGWERTTLHNETLLRHIGQTLSSGCLIWWLPERKFGIIVMGNVYKQADHVNEALARRLVEDRLSIPEDKRFDMATLRKKLLDQQDHLFSGAVDEMYPSKLDRSIPPSVSIQDLAGEYHNAGYGSLVFKPTNETDSTVLLAERPDTVFQYNVRLEHVSGDDWLAFYLSRLGSRLPRQYFRSQFKFNGTKAALDVHMGDDSENTYTVTFTKVA